MEAWQIWGLLALVGLLLGAAAYNSVPGKIRGGLLLSMAVGALACVGTSWIGSQVGVASQGTMIGFIVAAIGTALVLAIWRVTMGHA
jgi:uncharacterized membrane protein YeaQ/YmgE (transglycosylase-associated protein family)